MRGEIGDISRFEIQVRLAMCLRQRGAVKLGRVDFGDMPVDRRERLGDRITISERQEEILERIGEKD